MADFSTPGFFYTPEEQAQAANLARRQAYAQALLKQGSGDPGNAKFGGLRAAGQSILGAYLSNRLDKKQSDLTQEAGSNYTTALGKFLNPDANVSRETPPVPDIQPSPHLSSSAGTGPQTGPAQPMPPPQPGAPSPQVSNMAASGPQQPSPVGQPNPDQARINALLSTNNPGLIQQFAPGLVQHQQERQDAASDYARNRAAQVADKQRTVLSGDQAAALGFKPGTVISKDAFGGIQVEQASDLKSEGAVGQQQAEDLFKNQLGMTPQQQAEIALQQGTAAETSRHNRVEEGIAQNPFGTALGAPGAANLQGDDFLKTLPPGIASQIKAVGTYRQPAPAGRTSPTGIKFMTLVNQAYPSYDATQYGTKVKARNDFATTSGKTVQSLNVGIQHLNLLDKLIDAQNNGDVQAVNQISNAWQQQFGSAAPTNAQAAASIVGDEITKAVIGGGGALSDRQKNEINVLKASPAQAKGAIQTYKGLMAGQLSGLKQRYSKATGLDDFEDYLSPETRAQLEGSQGGAAAAPSGKGQKVGRFIVEPQ